MLADLWRGAKKRNWLLIGRTAKSGTAIPTGPILIRRKTRNISQLFAAASAGDRPSEWRRRMESDPRLARGLINAAERQPHPGHAGLHLRVDEVDGGASV